MKYLIISTLLLTGCATKHKVDGELKVQPIAVNHKVSVDVLSLKEFYRDICELDSANDTPEKIDICINKKVDEFLNALSISSI